MGERAKPEIIFTSKASNSIEEIAIYIALKGYPETALKFKDLLYEFAFSLTNFPEKYPLCKRKSFKRQNLKCVAFKKNYIFVYKLIGAELVIYNVIHSKRLK